MAGRNLEELQKKYNKSAASSKGFRGMFPGPGPGGPRGMGKGRVGKPKNALNTIKRLISYVAKYKFRLILVVLLMFISTGTSLVGSYMLRPIINNAVALSTPVDKRIAYLAHLLIILVCIYLIGVLSSYLQSKIMLSVSQNATEKIRNDLFSSLQELPLRFFDNESTGEIMSRFTNDVDNIDAMLNNSLVSLISGTIALVGTFAFMVCTNIWLTAITVAFIPVFAKGGGAIAKRSSKYYGGQQAALGAVNGYIEESVTGQKVVKVFNHEDACIDEFTLLNNDMREKQFKAQFYGGIMGPVMGNTSQITYAFTAGIGGLLCLYTGFDVGGLSIFAGYSRQFSMPINMISQQTSTIFAALAGAERVFGIMDRPPEGSGIEPPESPEMSEGMLPPDGKTPGSMPQLNGNGKNPAVPKGMPVPRQKLEPVVMDKIEGHVVLDDVTFRYVPGKTVLKHITLSAEPGQKIAFVGSTGAGKTTITNLLNRFYEIDSGKITIDGMDIRRIDRDFLRANIAMVLQDTFLFTGTVMENIRYGRLDATDEEVMQAAKTASAHSFIMRLSNGYQTVLEGGGANLSQGQRQLLNIARAALSKAPILVLDEATSSVDTRTEKHIEHGMDRLMKNRTTFIIAHRLSTVRNSDIIMVLENGQIIERGFHEQLLALYGRYYELYSGVKELD